MPWVAIGTNDGTTVCNTHFGMSREYRLFSIENGEVLEQRTITNAYGDPERHKHAETDDIMSVLEGVDVCIGRKMGRKSPPIIRRYGRVPLLTKIEEVQECLDAFLALRSEAFRQFSMEDNQWIPMDPKELQSLVMGRDEDGQAT